MKKDKFLIGIIAGSLLLVAIALWVFFTRHAVPDQYQREDGPKAVVFNYLLALQKGEYERAYNYLGTFSGRPSRNDFDRFVVGNRSSAENMAVKIGQETITGEIARVNLEVVNYSSGIFTNSYPSQEVAELHRENGQWKILQMPFAYWSFDWNTPVMK